MKIKIHKFSKNAPLQWSWFERIHDNYYEISLGKIWLGIYFKEN